MIKKMLAIICLVLVATARTQTLDIEYSKPEFSLGDINTKIISANLSAKFPFLNKSELDLLVGASLAFDDGQEEFANPMLGARWSLSKSISIHGALWLPSADNKNDVSLSALVATNDTRLGYFVPEAFPVQIGFDAFTNLPLGLSGDMQVAALSLFVDDEQVLGVNSFEFFVPHSFRVSTVREGLELGAALTGIWYATEDFGDAVTAQARFDAGLWIGHFKPTLEAAFPLTDELQSVIDNTVTVRLEVR